MWLNQRIIKQKSYKSAKIKLIDYLAKNIELKMKLSKITTAVGSYLLFQFGFCSSVIADDCKQLMEKQDFKNAEEICSQSCDDGDGDGYSCYALGKILAEFGETSQDYQEAATY